MHIDDLRPSEEGSPTIQQMQKVSPGTLVQHAIEEPVAMETDDAIPKVLYNRTEETDITTVYNRLDDRYIFIFSSHDHKGLVSFLGHRDVSQMSRRIYGKHLVAMKLCMQNCGLWIIIVLSMPVLALTYIIPRSLR